MDLRWYVGKTLSARSYRKLGGMMTPFFVIEEGEWMINASNLNWMNIRQDSDEFEDLFHVIATFIGGDELKLFSGNLKECQGHLKHTTDRMQSRLR